ncbi:MAG: vacuolar membrane-associated protein iml1 [Pycnora praestabilis]|nr:MAG: vacuolar membrane-associated protein iml1 [Pycnora praestabilis]
MSRPNGHNAIRGPPRRSSHLSQVSTGSAETIKADRREWRNSREASHQHVIHNPVLVEKICTLWIHDDIFSKEEVLLNTSLFPDGGIRADDLAEIVALKPTTAVRDFQNASKDGSAASKSGAQPTIEPQAAVTERKLGALDPHTQDEEEDEVGDRHDVDMQKRYLFVVKENFEGDLRTKHSNLQLTRPSNKVSVSSHIAKLFGLKNRMQVVVRVVDEAMNSASHVEISFRDEYLARADMWRLAISELSNKTVHKGQKVVFMGTIKAVVKSIYVRAQKVSSAYFSSANTKPIFRSESARYVLFIQMSKEMWEFDSEGSGEIVFNKVVEGFLPELFKRWVKMNARHLVSIILFTRVEYESDSATGFRQPEYGTVDPNFRPDGTRRPYRDYFRVVVSDIASGEWATILYQLKKEFRVFLRDVSIQSPFADKSQNISNLQESGTEKSAHYYCKESVIAGHPSAALHGNILEAINLATSQYSTDYIDRDLVRTGISIVVVTPGTGLFEVNYNMLKMTTETLIGNGVGIDLVCLSKMPLHSVPLFKYRNPQVLSRLSNVDQVSAIGDESTPRQKYSAFGSLSGRTSNLSPSRLPEYGTSPGKSVKAVPEPIAGEWSYAVPHWVDVSFWTGGSNEGPGRLIDDVAVQQNSQPSFKDFQSFVPRCKMYEVQMMGVMENEMSNISIPFIHESPFYSQGTMSDHSNTLVTECSPSAYDANNDENARPSVGVGRRQPFNPKSRSSVFGKSDRDHRISQEDREDFKWMEDYDDAIFRPLPLFRAVEKEARQRRRTDQRGKSRRPHDDDPMMFGTSFSDDDRSLGGLNAPAGTAYFDRKMSERRPSIDLTSKWKESTSSSFSKAASATLKPDRLSRQINFGLRGFGVAAPKAIASTELTSEHATHAKGRLSSSPDPQSSKNLMKRPRGLSRKSTLTSQDVKAVLIRGSANPEKTEAKSDTQSDGSTQQSRPIAIKSASKALDKNQQHISKADTDAVFEKGLKEKTSMDGMDLVHAVSMTKQAGPRIDLASSINIIETPATLSPTSALSPWLTILNPSNPKMGDVNTAKDFGRWQHVFPRPLRTSSMKWKSLCSPAAVPLTTGSFPTAEQLISEYQESPYNISQNDDEELSETPKTREDFLKELIAFRLSRGFQLVLGPAVAEATGKSSLKMVDVFDEAYMAEDGVMVFMSMGNTIHQLLCVQSGRVEIKRFNRKPTAAVASSAGLTSPVVYKPTIKTTLAQDYSPRRVVFQPPREEYNWNYVDTFIAGYEEDFTEQLRFWRARFVLIPIETPASLRRPLRALTEDNEEEIRLEGIRKLTQMWQRHRYVPPNERKFQASARMRKDTNPLDIVYETRDPSIMIAAKSESLPLGEHEPNIRQDQLFGEMELFQRSSLNIATLAQDIQSDGGVKMMDRRWHLRLHYNCFIGFDLTSWLLQHFRDVDTRDEAVELGNELMKNGLFQHVERRHQFRDGNFFYQIASEYRAPRPESRSGWFGTRRSDKSVPSTPLSEMISPRADRSRSSSSNDDALIDAEAATSTPGGGKKTKFALSKVMRYDVDHRKRSYRPELINLHYDRLHNPDNCYHIRIDWMNVTAKLIEDAIVSWATSADKFGLRLVEAPIGEAVSISESSPFRAPSCVRLAVPPPVKQPQNYFDVTSFTPQANAERHYYQKAIMKKFNFVLDTEAASNYPSDIEVTYSWGKPDYRYTQYIHRSGILLAQITDEGDFLLLANRLFNNRTAANKETGKFEKSDHHDRRAAGGFVHNTGQGPNISGGASDQPTPMSSPLVRATSEGFGPGFVYSGNGTSFMTPEKIRDELETFCNDSRALERFYDDVLHKLASPAPSTPQLESSIPLLGLPPSLTTRDASPSPILGPSKLGQANGAATSQSPSNSTEEGA